MSMEPCQFTPPFENVVGENEKVGLLGWVRTGPVVVCCAGFRRPTVVGPTLFVVVLLDYSKGSGTRSITWERKVDR